MSTVADHIERSPIFIDTEFTMLSQEAELISLAILTPSGDSFYAEFVDYARESLSQWHQDHVIAHLELGALAINSLHKASATDWQVRGDRTYVTEQLRAFFHTLGEVEAWIDYVAYDWVLFCELFGGSMQLPENLFYMPFDLVTLLKVNGIDPDIDRSTFLGQEADAPTGGMRHNARWDAYLLKRCYEKLTRSNS